QEDLHRRRAGSGGQGLERSRRAREGAGRRVQEQGAERRRGRQERLPRDGPEERDLRVLRLPEGRLGQDPGDQVGATMSARLDIARTAFFAYVTWLVARYALAVDNEPMTTIDWNKSHVYWLAFAGFALMVVRSVQVTWIHWSQGYSILEKPEAYDGVDE